MEDNVRLWLQREREKVEASLHASAGPPQASQRAAGCHAKPTTAKARDVPKPKRKKSAARLAKDRKRLNHKRLASKVWAFASSTQAQRVERASEG